jgi:hypothetical protein
MSDFRETDLLAKPANPLKGTAETKFWSKFAVAAVHKHAGAVAAIDYAAAGDVYAVTSSTRVRTQRKKKKKSNIFNSMTHTHNKSFFFFFEKKVLLYDVRTHELQHSISRFKDVAFGASFRRDGQLIVVGGAHPLVQVFHVSTQKRKNLTFLNLTLFFL